MREAATGKPIDGCRIELAEAQTPTEASTQTDAEGNWEAKDLMPGAYAVTARHEAYVPQRYPVRHDWNRLEGLQSSFGRGRRSATLTSSFKPGAFIAGKVLGPDNAPVADAAVVVFRECEPVENGPRFHNVPSAFRRTGADGSFRTGPWRPEAMPSP